MKKFLTVLLGLSLVLGAATATFAQEEKKQTTEKKTKKKKEKKEPKKDETK